jgi:hypothetical protein
MKTFKQFLLSEVKSVKVDSPEQVEEKEQIFKMFDKFFVDCKPYIEKNKRLLLQGRFLFRGLDNLDHNLGLGKFIMRTSRDSVGTHSAIHKKIGVWFKNKFGINYRETAVFCQGVFNSNIEHFGDPHIIFPCGENIKYCFSPHVNDLTLTIDLMYSVSSKMVMSKFVENNINKYIKPTSHYNPDDVNGVKSHEFMLKFFTSLYWYLSAEDFKSKITEKLSMKQLDTLLNFNLRDDDKFKVLFDHITHLMEISKTNQPFFHVLLAYFGFTDVEEFKNTLVQIGNDLMDTLKYVETDKQSKIPRDGNEIMVSCSSYVVIPMDYKDYLKEYIRETY